MLGEELLESAISDGSYFSNPFPLFTELRKCAPVFHSPTLGGWIVTRHKDVSDILHNHEDYSSKGRVLHLLNKLEPAVQNRLPMLYTHFATGLAHSDSPEHRRLRGILAQAFTPKISENMRPITKEVVTGVLKDLRGEADLISDVFTPVPALVVGRLLGSSEGDIPSLIRWAGAINGLYEKGGNIDPEKALHAEAMLLEIREFVNNLADERRSWGRNGNLDPAADVLSGLVHAEVQSESLSESELVSTVVTLFVAGHETTTHLLGNGMLALLKQPELIMSLQQEPNLIPDAIDEMARFDGSVPRSWRIAKKDMNIEGAAIASGDLVLPMLSSANRDEEIFEDPDFFDLHRDTRKHLAFGRGVHVCLGAPLARIEGQEILKEILLRFPKIALKDPDVELRWRRDVALRGLISLPVKL